MSTTIRRVSYYSCTATDRPGSAYQVLQDLARAEINLLAFSCVPIGPSHVQMTLYPEHPDQLEQKAHALGLSLLPAQEALLVQGDDEIGVLADAHRQLYDERIDVYASNGVTDARGAFGYLIHVRPEDMDRAADTLGC